MHVFYNQLVRKKRAQDWSKILKTLLLYLRIIMKLYNLNLYKIQYMELLPLVTLYNFCCEKIVTCDFDLLGHFS